ncbi:MAG TPA: hypothetical protein VFL14_08425 [Xanthomonadales bacterium]|nr:hypothetical protein [Xanthomonadales bacterium]
MDTPALHQLVILACNARLTADAIAPFLVDASHADFYDAFARHVAVEFIENRMPYEAADAAMSHLFVFACVEGEGDLPTYAREVFEAFDLGDYIHAGDPSGTNSERKYTRPRIRRLLEPDVVP